ncbi:MAG TPA: hypothetical protein VGI86_14365, partial [Acidimicrobiia bacterium]
MRLRPDSTIAGSTEAEWTHPLLREVAYDRLDDGTRRDAHVTVAHKLDDAAIEPEAIAHHAAAAFELGARDESAFVGDVSSRAARVALDRFALANADRWTALVRETGHEPVPGTADTLEAELLLRRGEFERSGTLADRWTDRDDEVGTQALAVSAEAHLATGEYDTAEHAAAAALARIPDSRRRDQLTSTYVELLKRRGDYEQAANLAADAAQGARTRGDRVFAARFGVQFALNSAYLANTRGEGIIPHIRAAEVAADELDALGDRRAFSDVALETASVIMITEPVNALVLLERAVNVAKDLEAVTRIGPLATLAAETALELDRPADARRWMAEASEYPADLSDRLYLRALRAASEIASGAESTKRMSILDEVASTTGSGFSTQLYPTVVRLWLGRVSGIDRGAIDGRHVAHVVARLAMRALDGPPWALPDEDLPLGAANDAALVLFLAGQREAGDELLRQRWRFLKQSGATYERYNAFYPGPLVMALG